MRRFRLDKYHLANATWDMLAVGKSIIVGLLQSRNHFACYVQ